MNLYLYYKSYGYSIIRPATAESLRSTIHGPHPHMDRGLWLEITGTKRYSMVSNTYHTIPMKQSRDHPGYYLNDTDMIRSLSYSVCVQLKYSHAKIAQDRIGKCH